MGEDLGGLDRLLDAKENILFAFGGEFAAANVVEVRKIVHKVTVVARREAEIKLEGDLRAVVELFGELRVRERKVGGRDRGGTRRRRRTFADDDLAVRKHVHSLSRHVGKQRVVVGESMRIKAHNL